MFHFWKASFRLSGLLLLVLVLFLSGSPSWAQTASDIRPLEPPQTQCGIDLLVALKNRHSDKAFLEKDLTPGQLSTILWAANGINRDNGKRTAPAPHAMPYLQLYVTGTEGTWLYEPKGHQLRLITPKNLKSSLPRQPAYASASHLLLLVADLSQFPKPEISTESKILMAHCNAGHIAQNVYLTTGALGLGTCMVANVASDTARQEIPLRDDQIPLYLMPLGFPK